MPSGLREAMRDYSIATWLPSSGSRLADRSLHLFMPLLVLTFFRWLAGAALCVHLCWRLRQDYVCGQGHKGLREQIVIYKHARERLLIPFVTIIVSTIPGIFSGAIITETVFAWPGMDASISMPLAAVTGRLPWPSSSSPLCQPFSRFCWLILTRLLILCISTNEIREY